MAKYKPSLADGNGGSRSCRGWANFLVHFVLWSGNLSLKRLQTSKWYFWTRSTAGKQVARARYAQPTAHTN